MIYDVGGTLLYPKPPIEELCAHAEAVSGVHVPHEAFARALAELRIIFRERDVPVGTVWASDELTRETWTDYYALAMERIGVHDDFERLRAVGRVMYSYYQHSDRWSVFDDVSATLAEGTRRGVVQGVLSDWGSDLPGILHGLGIDVSMQFVLASGIFGYAKPSVEVFRAALDRAGVAPREAVYVGDTYYLDIIGARSAGLHAALIDREGVSPPLDTPVLRRLDEVWDLVDELGGVGRRD